MHPGTTCRQMPTSASALQSPPGAGTAPSDDTCMADSPILPGASWDSPQLFSLPLHFSSSDDCRNQPAPFFPYLCCESSSIFPVFGFNQSLIYRKTFHQDNTSCVYKHLVRNLLSCGLGAHEPCTSPAQLQPCEPVIFKTPKRLQGLTLLCKSHVDYSPA